jgi:2-keto-4-pentenoate hydratase/2-oxohepta-3-ene-1,7-dioic acid hydratase in catechol pathway
MKLVTFKTNEGANTFRIGALVSDIEIADLTHLVSNSDLDKNQILTCFDLEQPFLEKARLAAEVGDGNLMQHKDVLISAPIPRPGKVICIGLNYRDHAAESGMAIPKSPVIFSKFATCIVGPGDPIVIPQGSVETDYEAELAFIIGRRASRVTAESAITHVFGYTNFNDVSARDFQFSDGQWQRGKSCDTFAPMGEYVATADEIPDPQDLAIKLRLNGETMQDSNTDQMIFGVAELVEFISRYITLEPGDVIATGTPPGVGFARKPPVYLSDGDVVEVEIDNLGVLSNQVVSG